MKLVIVHFQPLERYPPVMNVIQSLVDERLSFSVITTGSNNNWFRRCDVKILRLGNYHGGRLKRYLCFLHFNLLGFLRLIIGNPKVLLCYETTALGPVYFYKMFRPNTRIFLHFHEYESETEKNASSYYQKILQNFADELLSDLQWLSHTNFDRLEKYKLDNRDLKLQNLNVLPNYPCSSWAKEIRAINKINDNRILKLVYVGSLGLETTYIAEFIQWVEGQFGKVELSIYSQNIEDSVIRLIRASNSRHIALKSNISYFDLPTVLSQFDVGLVLYNGHSPNYIYNVPNKVNEYLACGLNVWYSDVLVSTKKFSNENLDYPLFAVDFGNGIKMKNPFISMVPFEYKHWHEDAVKPLINSLQRILKSE